MCVWAQSCLTLCDSRDSRLLCPWDFPGKNTGVGCHFLFQEILPTQVSSPALAGRFFTICTTREGPKMYY